MTKKKKQAYQGLPCPICDEGPHDFNWFLTLPLPAKDKMHVTCERCKSTFRVKHLKHYLSVKFGVSDLYIE